MKHYKNKIKIYPLACGLLIFIGYLAFFSARWYVKIFGDVGFDAILYTLFTDMEGVESGILGRYLLNNALPALACTIVTALLIFFNPKRDIIINIKKRLRLKIFPLSKLATVLISLGLAIALLINGANRVDMISYISYSLKDTDIYDEKYVEPSSVNISFPKDKQNLICIYLESMETAFFSKEQGGFNDNNPISFLYKMAEENTNFSNNSGVGGFSALTGSTWTTAALVAQTAGIPLRVEATKGNKFLPNATTLSDILSKNGYYQAFMMGSDSEFGERRRLFEEHGIDKIYDIYTARKDGAVPEDYFVWWGMEDNRLYSYAKQELTEIAKGNQPFAFNILTVDTHHTGGYVCRECGNEYAEPYENVLACADRQVFEFVNWIKQQDFFANTTIIICGDHPTMDNSYIMSDIGKYREKRVYNCIINPKNEAVKTKNRDFCSMDMFPTALAAIGCEIEGERLGLGTNMFSSLPTLCEEMGANNLNIELIKGNIMPIVDKEWKK